MKRIKILIVEDEMVSAMDLAQILGRRGYKICGLAATAAAAVATAEKELPDIVLVDVNLGGAVSGIEAAREIHSRFGTPVIFITGYSDEETRSAAEIAEPAGYFIKPVNIEELLTTIKSVVRQ
jgi:DNA-binding response OmpR family regulator